MLIFLTNRNGISYALPRLKVKGGKRYKVRTDIENLRTADPQYSCGKEIRGESIRQLYKEDRSVVRGERVDGVGNIRGYQVSGSLPRVVDRTKVRSKTCVDIAIDDTADVLRRIIRHRGYQANDSLADMCKDGQQKVVVDTTIYWVENGVKLQVHVGSIRVKKVTCIESTKLMVWNNRTEQLAKSKNFTMDKNTDYFKYLEKQFTRTEFGVKHNGEVVDRTTVVDKTMYRYKYAKLHKTYDFMFNSDDLRDLREKVRLARMTTGYKQIEL